MIAVFPACSHQGNPLTRKGRGATFAEFTINGDTSYLLPDTTDISEVNGVNALYKMVLPPIPSQAYSVNYPKFFCCSSYICGQNKRANSRKASIFLCHLLPIDQDSSFRSQEMQQKL